MANSFEEERDVPETDTLAGLAANLVIRLPGCTDEMIRRTLQSVYVDFCKAACVLSVTKTVNVAEDEVVDSVAVKPSTASRYVDFVKGVRCGCREMAQGADYTAGDGEIRFNYRMTNCTIEIDVVEVPVPGSEKATRDFIRRYGPAVESGVLSRLMAMTGRPWSDPAQARIEAVNYNDAITSAKLAYYSGSSLSNGSASGVGRGLLV